MNIALQPGNLKSIEPLPAIPGEFLNRGRINQRFGAMTLTSARLLDRSRMPDVISPAWKPHGHRKTV